MGHKISVKTIVILLLVFCFTACGGALENRSSGQTSPDSSWIEAFIAALQNLIDRQTTLDSSDNDTLAGTYWTAVQYQFFEWHSGLSDPVPMPGDMWWADLFLNEDGTAKFREVMFDGFGRHLDNGTWQLGADGSLTLTNLDYPGEGMTGWIEGDRIRLESIYGDIYYLEQEQHPKPGGEMCIADLRGNWRMTQVEMGGKWYPAREKGMASTLRFDFDFDYSDPGVERYLLADYNFASALDTGNPEYQEMWGIGLEYWDRPLFDGISNEVWSAQLFSQDRWVEIYLTLTDLDTLYLQEHYELNGSTVVRTAIYERVESLLPESLWRVLYEEPADRLLLYWPNPSEDVRVPLEMLPVTKLEENPLHRLLLVGCWNDTQICFCTGEGVWDDNGNLVGWIVDQTVYEGMINVNEPKWFSLTIPEGVPGMCLYIKHPSQDDWYLWPITDTDGYLVNKCTFLTS